MTCLNAKSPRALNLGKLLGLVFKSFLVDLIISWDIF
jgi:hypothetical protein